MRSQKLSLLCASLRSVVLMLLVASTSVASAQLSNENNTGFPENAVLHGGEFDNVQAANGNLHIQIPVWTSKGRGVDTGVYFVYDSKGWELDISCDYYCDGWANAGWPLA